MVSFQARFEQIGEQRGIQIGRQLGEAKMLLNLMHTRFGPLPDPVRQRIEQADPDTLLRWSSRLLTEDSIDAVLR